MQKEIRLLTMEDLPLLRAMHTGIEDDYVIRVFERIVKPPNALYGLLVGDQLAALCGYTIFAGRYAMLGRLRSDLRMRGRNYSTELTAFVRDRVFENPAIIWVGANTQEHNTPARRVLQKQGFGESSMLYGAVAKDVSSLCSGATLWTKTADPARKKEWLQQLYVQGNRIFPYECYYNFPATTALFSDQDLAGWDFLENGDKSRFVIIKRDVKKHAICHVIYPWNDFMEQPGLWETVQDNFSRMKEAEGEETHIWMDLDKEGAALLPAGHPFELPSPWVLYGTFRSPEEHGAAESFSASSNQ